MYATGTELPVAYKSWGHVLENGINHDAGKAIPLQLTDPVAAVKAKLTTGSGWCFSNCYFCKGSGKNPGFLKNPSSQYYTFTEI